MVTKEKRSEIIRLYGQLKSFGKTTIQASVSKDTVIRVLKNRNRKTRKQTGRPEALSVGDKRRIRRKTRQLIRQDDLVTSHIIKNKTGITACHWTICLTSDKQDFSYERIKKQLPLIPEHGKSVSSSHTNTLSNSWTSSKKFSRMINAFAFMDPTTSFHLSNIEVIASSHHIEWAVKWVMAVSSF